MSLKDYLERSNLKIKEFRVASYSTSHDCIKYSLYREININLRYKVEMLKSENEKLIFKLKKVSHELSLKQRKFEI